MSVLGHINFNWVFGLVMKQLSVSSLCSIRKKKNFLQLDLFFLPLFVTIRPKWLLMTPTWNTLWDPPLQRLSSLWGTPTTSSRFLKQKLLNLKMGAQLWEETEFGNILAMEQHGSVTQRKSHDDYKRKTLGTILTWYWDTINLVLLPSRDMPSYILRQREYYIRPGSYQWCE